MDKALVRTTLEILNTDQGGSWIDFYNEVRPHSSLGGRTPGETYRNGARAG